MTGTSAHSQPGSKHLPHLFALPSTLPSSVTDTLAPARLDPARPGPRNLFHHRIEIDGLIRRLAFDARVVGEFLDRSVDTTRIIREGFQLRLLTAAKHGDEPDSSDSPSEVIRCSGSCRSLEAISADFLQSPGSSVRLPRPAKRSYAAHPCTAGRIMQNSSKHPLVLPRVILQGRKRSERSCHPCAWPIPLRPGGQGILLFSSLR